MRGHPPRVEIASGEIICDHLLERSASTAEVVLCPERKEVEKGQATCDDSMRRAEQSSPQVIESSLSLNRAELP
jgi:hypothetical protein